MILAAGRGQRLRPLTNKVPKPLIKINGKALIEHLMASLKAADIDEVIINHAHLGKQIEETLGDGTQYKMVIHYSPESPPGLETGGGIQQALPLLGKEPFIVVNGDIWTDFPFNRLPKEPERLAHLVMVDNPKHNPDGDFALCHRLLSHQGEHCLTFSGIGIYKPELFEPFKHQGKDKARFPLKKVLLHAMQTDNITGEYYSGDWMDIGNHERLSTLRARFQ